MTDMCQETIKTPCVGICRYDEYLGMCVGCGRTRFEITAWADMTDKQREIGMEVAAHRLEGFFK